LKSKTKVNSIGCHHGYVLCSHNKCWLARRKELESIDGQISKERSLMNALKMDRDSTREEATELVRRQGFGTSDMLLTDFEKRRTAIAGIKFELMELEARYQVLFPVNTSLVLLCR
jgi:hypothetical protein